MPLSRTFVKTGRGLALKVVKVALSASEKTISQNSERFGLKQVKVSLTGSNQNFC
jgi:hypothetical protein